MTKLAGLQTARAMAALMVLTGHVIAEAEHYFAIDLPGDAIPWTRGVDLFFVISGFIVIRSADRWQAGSGAFLARRFLRVAPLYYLFTTLMVLTLLAAPGAAKDTALEPGQIVASYLFFPVERYDGRIAPVLSLGWTLNYEMAFYAVLSGALMLRRPVRTLCAIFAAAALLGALIGPAGVFEIGIPAPMSALWRFSTNPIFLEFAFGMILARLWHRRAPDARLALICALAGIVALVGLDATPLPRFVAAGLPAMLIVAAASLFAPDIRWPLQRIGDASYALYLSHRFTLRAMTLVLLPVLPATPIAAVLFCGIVMAASVLVGWIVFATIERPVLAALDVAPERRRAASRT
ncbi:acyltransferase family protein [Roseivivax sp. CAU 1753]